MENNILSRRRVLLIKEAFDLGSVDRATVNFTKVKGQIMNKNKEQLDKIVKYLEGKGYKTEIVTGKGKPIGVKYFKESLEEDNAPTDMKSRLDAFAKDNKDEQIEVKEKETTFVDDGKGGSIEVCPNCGKEIKESVIECPKMTLQQMRDYCSMLDVKVHNTGVKGRYKIEGPDKDEVIDELKADGYLDESLKEDIDENALSNCDANYQIGIYEGEDFMIVDSWEDVQEIQKCLDPDFQPKDKYDTSILDEYIAWGFRDGYTTCDACSKVIRTEPDSYSWVPDFWVNDESGEIYCGDCVRENPNDYLASLVNNPKVANTILGEDDFEDAGFVKMDGDYENGWYDRVDSPEEILDALLEKYPYGEFVFSITSQGQFATRFEVWGDSSTLTQTDEE